MSAPLPGYVLKTGPEGLSQSPIGGSAQHDHFLAIQGGDYSRRKTLFDVAAQSGPMRRFVANRPTFLQIGPLGYDEPAVRYLAGDRRGRVVFPTRRLEPSLLVDARSGAIKAKLGSGNWSCGDVAFVDESSRLLYFIAAGRESGEDPYLRHLYSVQLDGRGLAC